MERTVEKNQWLLHMLVVLLSLAREWIFFILHCHFLLSYVTLLFWVSFETLWLPQLNDRLWIGLLITRVRLNDRTGFPLSLKVLQNAFIHNGPFAPYIITFVTRKSCHKHFDSVLLEQSLVSLWDFFESIRLQDNGSI